MKSLKYILLGLLLVGLAACGGGGGNPGTTGAAGGGLNGVGATVQYPALSLQLKDATGASTQSVGASGGAELWATLTVASGTVLSGRTITVDAGSSSLVFFPNGNSATTDANGTAKFKVSRASQTEFGSGFFNVRFDGTGYIFGTFTTTTTSTGTTTTSGCAAAATLCLYSAFESMAFRSDPPAFQLELRNSAGVTTGISATDTTTLVAKLKFADGTPVVQKRVDVTSDPDGKVVFPKGNSQTTNKDGEAFIEVARGSNANGAGSLLVSSTIGGSTSSGTTYTTDVKGKLDYQVEVIPTDTNTKVKTVEVVTSTNALKSAGSPATITAFVKNGFNVVMPGQAVVFSATSGTLQNPSSATDANGVASVQVIPGNDKTNRTITVTVTANGVSGSVDVPVTDSKLAITGSASMQTGTGAQKITVRASDSAGNPVPGVPIKLGSSLGNAVSPSTATTDVTGNASFSYTPVIAGTDTVSATGLGTSAANTIAVSAVNFTAVAPAVNSQIPIGSAQTVTVQYLQSGAGVPGKTVAFSTTRGALSQTSAITDASGQATVTVSSTTAGSAVVAAQIVGVGSLSLPVQFVATTPTNILLQANPGAISPNSPTTTSKNQSTIQALVTDAAANPVANRQVNFTIVKDLSNGSLSSGSVLTDSNGIAQVQFIAGPVSTPSNGVQIRADVAGTTVTSSPKDAFLTVNGSALFITIGFGNTIADVGVTDYAKPFSVYVTDANGIAVGNQVVALSVLPDEYYKGYLTYKGSPKLWGYSSVKLGDDYSSPYTLCKNEDKNLNGVLDAGEDENQNGRLTPGNVVFATPGSVTTDATGRATFDVVYGKQYALWVKVNLGARAVVAGTESSTGISYILEMSTVDAKLDSTAANAVSPFGTSFVCTDAR